MIQQGEVNVEGYPYCKLICTKLWQKDFSGGRIPRSLAVTGSCRGIPRQSGTIHDGPAEEQPRRLQWEVRVGQVYPARRVTGGPPWGLAWSPLASIGSLDNCPVEAETRRFLLQLAYSLTIRGFAYTFERVLHPAPETFGVQFSFDLPKLFAVSGLTWNRNLVGWRKEDFKDFPNSINTCPSEEAKLSAWSWWSSLWQLT